MILEITYLKNTMQNYALFCVEQQELKKNFRNSRPVMLF